MSLGGQALLRHLRRDKAWARRRTTERKCPGAPRGLEPCDDADMARPLCSGRPIGQSGTDGGAAKNETLAYRRRDLLPGRRRMNDQGWADYAPDPSSSGTTIGTAGGGTTGGTTGGTRDGAVRSNRMGVMGVMGVATMAARRTGVRDRFRMSEDAQGR